MRASSAAAHPPPPMPPPAASAFARKTHAYVTPAFCSAMARGGAAARCGYRSGRAREWSGTEPRERPKHQTFFWRWTCGRLLCGSRGLYHAGVMLARLCAADMREAVTASSCSRPASLAAPLSACCAAAKCAAAVAAACSTPWPLSRGGPGQPEAPPSGQVPAAAAGVAAHLRATPRQRRIRRRSPPAQERVQCAAAGEKTGGGGPEKRSMSASQRGRAGDAHACSTGRAAQLLSRRNRTLALPTSAACCAAAGSGTRRGSGASGPPLGAAHFKTAALHAPECTA